MNETVTTAGEDLEERPATPATANSAHPTLGHLIARAERAATEAESRHVPVSSDAPRRVRFTRD